MQRRPKARSFPARQRDETDLTPEALMALRPALAEGLRRSGDLYIGVGAVPASSAAAHVHEGLVFQHSTPRFAVC
jgi:hypothetical protein